MGNGSALGVSGDGLVVVGKQGCAAFRWTADSGMVSLGWAGDYSRANDVSGEGSCIVGSAEELAGPYHRVWMTYAVVNGTRLSVPVFGSASAISANGAVVVGTVWELDETSGPCFLRKEAFRWTAQTGIFGLGQLPSLCSESSVAEAVSGNGFVIVGQGNSELAGEAFVWQKGIGMRALKEVLVGDCGLDLTDWTLTNATGVSYNGLTIVGNGINPSGQTEAWIATMNAIGGIYGGGSGTPKDPFQIWDANHMQTIGAEPNDWGSHFRLMADIDLGQFDGKEGREKFNVIGDGDDPFTGVFNGNDHTVSDFIYDSNDRYYVGIFGYVEGEYSEIKNLGLINPNVVTRYYTSIMRVGSLVGEIVAGSITNCYSEGGSVTALACVYTAGGLVGGSDNGIITNCYSTTSVSIPWRDDPNCGTPAPPFMLGVGSLVGNNYRGTVTNCYAGGDVSSNTWSDGGLVGSNWDGIVANCYSTVSVDGGNTGGLVGSSSGSITNSYWDIETSGEPNMCGYGNCDNSYGKTTSEMHHQSTFTDWDFINTWNIGENQTYPYLRTVSPGDINKDRITNFLDIAILCEEWLIEE
jgi:uncharacterized membrane protein